MTSHGREREGHDLAVAASAVLAGAMAARLYKTRKPMPAGGVFGIALITSIYNAQRSLEWRNAS